MSKQRGLVGAALVVVAGLAGGCDQGTAGAPGSARACEGAATSKYTFATPGAGSRVERTARRDGSEVLHGVTETAGQRLVEEVEIAPSGRLVSARITRGSRAAGGSLRVEVDAVHGTVHVLDGAASESWTLPSSEPWALAPDLLDRGAGPLAATPVMAWIALRAARAGSSVRLVGAAASSSHLIAPDQLVVDDGAAHWILLGDEIAEADDDFVVSIPLPAADPRMAQLGAGLLSGAR